VDEFRGGLAGLLLAEFELAPGEAFGALPGIPAVDVTRDDRFSGGCLAAAAKADVRELLGFVAAAVDR